MKPILFLFAVALGWPDLSEAAAPPSPPPAAPGTGRPPFTLPGATPGRPQPRPYKDVITDKAKTQKGVFVVHELDDKVFFEIPADQLEKEFLWTAELAKAPVGMYSGSFMSERIIRWVKRGDRILLRFVNYSLRAEKGESVKLGVESASLEPIVMAFDIAAYSEGEVKSAVIDVTRLYLTNPGEFAVRVGVGAVDATRSFLERVKAFPTNIEVESLLTFGGGGPSGPTIPGLPIFGGGGGGTSRSAVVHYSMVRLPDQPMMGRLFDSRVGYFSTRFDDYSTDEHRVAERQFITRYRLEKKDPSTALSEPVKPIVYYVSREVPEKWKAYCRKGVEDWQVAFEAAGFKNAIIAKDAPSVKDDPDWSPEDARYSVIRWAQTPTENAQGPHVHDPRSGEIISAHIVMWHNILNLQTRWYFSQASPNDPRAQKLPFPDDLMGELVRFVVAHEVGHTLGMQHNFKASSAVTVKQLRDPKWTKENGTAGSIMDYARFNYVTQPGDGANLIPMVGAYDKFHTEWGYKPLPGAKNPQDEVKALDEIAARQVTNPILRFGGNPVEDPSQQTEDLGSDAVEATRLGLLNLERVVKYVYQAATKPGEDYDDLTERYGDLWSQWNRELGHVVPMVGGVVMTNWHAGRGAGNGTYKPVPRERQKAAVSLLLERGLHPPMALLRPEILDNINRINRLPRVIPEGFTPTPSGPVERVLASQSAVLSRLLTDARLSRMSEHEMRNGAAAYGPSELLRDVRTGLWSELKQKQPSASVYRRNIQRVHVNNLIAKLDNKGSGVRALAVGELRALLADVRGALPRAAGDTKSHLDDARLLIESALRPGATVNVAAAALAAPTGRGGWELDWHRCDFGTRAPSDWQ